MFWNMKKNIPFLSCLVILLILSYYNYYNSYPKAFPERVYGQPVVASNYGNLNISIEQVVQDDTYIYAMLHHSNGVVQVHDLDGNYQFSLFFYCHGKGGFSLAFADNILYVQDMRDNVYVFERGEFRAFVKADDAKKQFPELNFKIQEITEGYEIESGCVWRVADGERVCIIGAPKNINYNKNSVAILIGMSLFILIGFKEIKKNR